MNRKHTLILLAISLPLGLAAGCSAASQTPATPVSPTDSPAPAVQVPATIEFIGHESVLITASDGTRIVADPYSERPDGLRSYPLGIKADAVTVSHLHSDHSNSGIVAGHPQVFTAPGSYQVGEVQIIGLQSHHAVSTTVPGGQNTVFVFQFGGVKIVHLGESGFVTEQPVLDALKDADVVIYCVAYETQQPAADQLRQFLDLGARTLIPGHYSLDGSPRWYGLPFLSEYLAAVPADLALVHPGTTLGLHIGMPVQIAVMDPAANAR